MSGLLGHRGLLVGPGSDPHWSSVVLLLDASERASNAKPSDIDVKGNVPTWSNNANCVGLGYMPKFGRSCLAFNNDPKSRISFPDSSAWHMGTGDFTIGMWARPYTAESGYDRTLIGQAATYDGKSPFRIVRRAGVGGAVGCYVSDGTTNYGGNTPNNLFPNGGWSHIALVRYGQYLFCYVNGTRYQVASGLAGVSVMDSSSALAVGAFSDNDTLGDLWMGGWRGHLDQVRITKGVARYTTPTIAKPSAIFPRG